MSLPLKSQQDYYNIFITALQNAAPGLTDTLDGSIIDTLGGVFSIASMEMQAYILDLFSRCFFELANGPEITGGPDDLQTLAVDHFGVRFERPLAAKALDTVTFTRANNSAGAITIPAGTVVKTSVDSNGESQRYITDAAVILTNDSSGTDLSISVGITAVVAGKAGNAVMGAINVIESSLLDTTIAVSNAGNATGSDAQDDATYRETIRNLIESLAGATLQAIEATAKTVTGVSQATAVEQAVTVKQYDPITNSVSGADFRIPKSVLYVADATGIASPSLLQKVRDAIEDVRSCGVYILVESATALAVNWTASITLNPLGPNYGTLQTDKSTIVTAMKDYINKLPVGTSFVRATANAAILALYGPAGTDDITVFTTSVPVGDVAATATQKLIAGTVGLS